MNTISYGSIAAYSTKASIVLLRLYQSVKTTVLFLSALYGEMINETGACISALKDHRFSKYSMLQL